MANNNILKYKNIIIIEVQILCVTYLSIFKHPALDSLWFFFLTIHYSYHEVPGNIIRRRCNVFHQVWMLGEM